MPADSYIERIRNCEITAEEALADLQDEFDNAHRSLTRIKDVFEAIGVASGEMGAKEAIAALEFIESWRDNPFLG